MPPSVTLRGKGTALPGDRWFEGLPIEITREADGGFVEGKAMALAFENDELRTDHHLPHAIMQAPALFQWNQSVGITVKQ